MPDDETSGEQGADGSWLLEPLGPGEVRVHVSVGDDVELTPEFRATLDELLAQLQSSDVAGFGMCTSLDSCTNYTCVNLGDCQPLTNKPCFADMHCKVASFGGGAFGRLV